MFFLSNFNKMFIYKTIWLHYKRNFIKDLTNASKLIILRKTLIMTFFKC